MNYYKARQRESDQRWDYTCSNKRTGCYPVGYCHEWRDWSENLKNSKEYEKYLQFKHKHHSDGHATAEESEGCYKEYLIDHRLNLDMKFNNMQRKCEVCQSYTESFAEIDGISIVLCNEHRSLEEVKKRFQVHESWSSY
jgi:hypothetical protein